MISMINTEYNGSDFSTYNKNGVDKELEVRKFFKVDLGRKEEFFITYCGYVALIFDLKYANDIKLMVQFCTMGEFDTGVVSLTPKRRKEIMDIINISPTDFSKSLRRLKEKKIIEGVDGEFVLNPALFWKGDSSKRVQMLKKKGLSVTFGFKLSDDEEDEA